MVPSSSRRRGGILSLLTPLLLLSSAPAASAARMLGSTSLTTCMDNSGLSTTLFNVTFTPDNGALTAELIGDSSIIGFVRAKLTVLAYGFKALEQSLDPCATTGLEGMCPMRQAPLNMKFARSIEKDMVNQIPGIAYTIPDLDGVARMEVFSDKGVRLACVEAPLTNGKSVEQNAVGWVTAVIAGGALIASAIVSGLGHSATAAHVAANALSLFSYFQSQAMVSMVAVPLPPLVAAWTQNYDWSMGIIRIKFMQQVLHWYVQATGGKPSNVFKEQEDVSVQIAKRGLDGAVQASSYLMSRAAMYGFGESTENPFSPVVTGLVPRDSGLVPRSNNGAVLDSSKLIKVTGIERMAFKAKIESTNFFMTGMSFFVAFIVLVALGVMAFKGIVEAGSKKMKAETFRDFRNRWQTVLKGIMYRIVLIGFPQMAIICPWEMTRRDSPAVVVLAVFFFVCIFGILCWACFKVLAIARHSASIDKNLGPAYQLYSDPDALNRWGYLYVQFRQHAYYFIVSVLIYTLAKALIIALGQDTGKAQACAILAVELIYLGGIVYLHPWLDRRTNIVNIGISVLNTINAIFVFIFSDLPGAPEPVIGVLGVVFFIANAVFALVLLILVVVSTAMAIFSKNPEERFQPLPASGTTLEKASAIRDLDDDGPGTVNSHYEPAGPSSQYVANPPPPGHASSIYSSGAPQPPPLRRPSSAGTDSHRSARAYPLPPSTAGSDRAWNNSPFQPDRSFNHSPFPQQHQQQPGAAINWNTGVGYDRG